jgi:hypothetical protein
MSQDQQQPADPAFSAFVVYTRAYHAWISEPTPERALAYWPAFVKWLNLMGLPPETKAARIEDAMKRLDEKTPGWREALIPVNDV